MKTQILLALVLATFSTAAFAASGVKVESNDDESAILITGDAAQKLYDQMEVAAGKHQTLAPANFRKRGQHLVCDKLWDEKQGRHYSCRLILEEKNHSGDPTFTGKIESPEGEPGCTAKAAYSQTAELQESYSAE